MLRRNIAVLKDAEDRLDSFDFMEVSPLIPNGGEAICLPAF
jgi:hypothetical protein